VAHVSLNKVQLQSDQSLLENHEELLGEERSVVKAREENDLKDVALDTDQENQDTHDSAC